MLNTINTRAGTVGDAFLAASRQAWLAGLGAAVVTRDWAQNEAGTVLRTLVKEGSAVESRTIRIVGDQVETSFAKASALWKQARDTVTFTVKEYADTAVALVKQTLPGTSPKRAVAVRKVVRTRKAVRVAKAKPAKARSARVVKKVKRATKRA